MTVVLKQETFLDSFPVPEYLLLSTSGIAITDKGVKFIQFRRKSFSNNRKIIHSHKILLPIGAVDSGFINDKNAVVAALKELKSLHDICYARATLPEERAYLFTATIDKVPFEGLRDAVAFIVEENVPVSLPESVFDFEIIENDPQSSKIKVSVTVLPKEVVNIYIKIFEAAGITPISFDLESQAIARVIIPRGDRRTTLIINLGEKKTGFYVVKDEVVEFSTTPAHGIPPLGVAPNLYDLKAEMRKVFGFWGARVDRDGATQKKIEKVLLCGAGSGNAEVVRELMSECLVEYALAEVWINSTSVPDRVSAKIIENPLEYLAAIGVALPRSEKNYV